MARLGGFIFNPENSCEKLRVPNLVATKRFAHTILRCYVGEMDSMYLHSKITC
jgi:hypothetical protein